MSNKLPRVLVLVPSLFEDIELIATIDVFSRNNLAYSLVSIENKLEVMGKYAAIVKTVPLNQIVSNEFTSLFLPGGPGYKLFLENNHVLKIIQEFYHAKKLISAICAAPEVLIKANIIDNQVFTAYPGFAQVKNNTGKELEINDYLITARDYKVTIKFAEAIVKSLV